MHSFSLISIEIKEYKYFLFIMKRVQVQHLLAIIVFWLINLSFTL